MIKIDQQEKQLGNLKFGKPYNFKYVLTNLFDKQIVIKNIAVGCSSCTKASISRRVLKPNEDAIIDVVFTPGSTGIQSKTISVGYSTEDNVSRPDILLKFKATINNG